MLNICRRNFINTTPLPWSRAKTKRYWPQRKTKTINWNKTIISFRTLVRPRSPQHDATAYFRFLRWQQRRHFRFRSLVHRIQTETRLDRDAAATKSNPASDETPSRRLCRLKASVAARWRLPLPVYWRPAVVAGAFWIRNPLIMALSPREAAFCVGKTRKTDEISRNNSTF